MLKLKEMKLLDFDQKLYWHFGTSKIYTYDYSNYINPLFETKCQPKVKTHLDKLASDSIWEQTNFN